LNRSLNLEEHETHAYVATLNETEASQAEKEIQTKLKTAETVIHLMLSMSSDAIMTETLALAGIMRVLCNNSLRAFQEMYQIYINEKRNIWHRLWCLIVTLVTAILRTLSKSEALIEQVIEFLAIHNSLLSRNVGRPTAPYQLAQLEEVERVTLLIYELGVHWKQWRFVHGKIAKNYEDNMVVLVHSLVVALASDQMSLFVQPATKKQKILLQPLIIDGSLQGQANHSREPGKEPKTPKCQPELRPLYLVAESQMYHILRNCLSFLRVVGPHLPPTLLTNHTRLEHIDWDAFKPIFDDLLSFETPSLPLPRTVSQDEDSDMHIDETPRAGSFGFLFGGQLPRATIGLLIKGVLHVCANALKEALSREGKPFKLMLYTRSLAETSKNILKRETANRSLCKPLKKICLQLEDHHHLLYFCIQVTLYMILSHLVIFIHGKNQTSNRGRVDLGIEMESFFARLVRDLSHKKERGDLPQAPDQAVEEYLKFFSGTKSYFEQLLNNWAASQKSFMGHW